MKLAHPAILAASLRAAATLAAIGLAATALAHEGEHHPAPGPAPRLKPETLVQLEDARRATAKFRDVDVAVAKGYVDIGLFVPNMGWHYLKESLLDGRFDPETPELLVYADDPCGGKRRLVAVEYAVPFADSDRAPRGFVGRADEWDANATFQLWTLHAWVWEYNTDGVFAPLNPIVD
jgi:hypothetical protein